MKFITIKEYTHHGGTSVKLSQIPVGTLIQRAIVTDSNPGMEYVTVGFGDESQYYIGASVVENSPEYFKEISNEEYWKEIGKRELINTVLLNEERGITPEEAINMIAEHFGIHVNKEKEDLARSFQDLMEEIDRVKEQSQKMPFEPYPGWQPIGPGYRQPVCQCGNDGTRPCWSTACPNRLIVTYSSTTTYNK
jgi:hypothetical protein